MLNIVLHFKLISVWSSQLKRVTTFPMPRRLPSNGFLGTFRKGSYQKSSRAEGRAIQDERNRLGKHFFKAEYFFNNVHWKLFRSLWLRNSESESSQVRKTNQSNLIEKMPKLCGRMEQPVSMSVSYMPTAHCTGYPADCQVIRLAD